MTQHTTQHATQPTHMDRAFDAICMLLMPFFLLAAGDNPEKARAAVADLIRAYHPATTQELDLVARIVGFGVAALDNLRLSMTTPDLSDTKILRYRSTAVSLSRSAEQCRTTLNRLRTEPPEMHPPVQQQAAPQPRPAKPPAPLPPMSTAALDKAKSDARAMLAGLAKLGATCPPGQGLTALRIAPEPGAQITAAVAAAVTEMKNRNATQKAPA